MVVRRKQLTIIALALCGIALMAWFLGTYLSKRAKQEQYQQALAQRFDKAIDIAYPLIESYALSVKDRVDSIEVMAKRSKEDHHSSYKEAFGRLWVNYTQTEGARKNSVLLEELEYFKLSPFFSMLMDSGEKRQKEAEAIRKINWAGELLKKPCLIEYDSLMIDTKQARQFVSDGLEVLEPYHSENDNIHAWRIIQ
jgi:hypothetical protein